MGVKGAMKYFDSQSMIYSPPSANDRKKAAWDKVFRPDHFLLDMNCILHLAFDNKQPYLASWIENIKRQLAKLFSLFRPSKTVTIVFDGVAPLGKLLQQRERRKDLPLCKEFLGPEYAKKRTVLAHEEMTAGSPLLAVCEETLKVWLPTIINDQESDVRIHWSPSTEPGEGEIKISAVLRTFFDDGVARGSDSFTILGNDSDLVFISLVATPYQYLSVVNPETLNITLVSQLIQHWSKAVPNPPLHPPLLQSYRVDFTFIMLLAGCDYYSGIGEDARNIWSTYRRLRADGGYFKTCLINGDGCDIDVGFLRVLLSKSSRNIKHRGPVPRADADVGQEVLRGAMWSLQMMIRGYCVNPHYVSKVTQSGRFIPLQSLVMASQRRNIGETISNIHTPPEWTTEIFEKHHISDDQLMLSPLEQYICVMGGRGRYSPALKSAIHLLNDCGDALNRGSSVKILILATKEVTQTVNREKLLPCEREMLVTPTKGDPPACNTFMSFYCAIKDAVAPRPYLVVTANS
eukprot:gene8709-6125_t